MKRKLFPIVLLVCAVNVLGKHQILTENPDFEKSLPIDFITTKCRPRNRLISTVLKDFVEYVTAPIGRTVVLMCNFCWEEPDSIPKMWYYSSRELGLDPDSIGEVELGMRDDERRNHFFLRSDGSLVINDVNPSDTGYYYCHGTKGEGAENKINFLVDVIKNTGAVVGNREDWRSYKSSTYPELKRRIAATTLYTQDLMDSKARKHQFYFHVLSEWTPWSRCDGCAGMRSKIAECKLVPTPPSNLKHQLQTKKISATITVPTSTTSTTTTTCPQVGNNTKLRYLLFEYGVACQSQELDEARPDVSAITKDIKPFILIEPCIAVCSESRRSDQPKFQNTIILQEGDHITLVCPAKSTMSNTVEWRKDAVLISNHAADDDSNHIVVDTFSNLYITHARAVESGKYACYVNGVKLQEVIVSVNAEAVRKHAAFMRHMHYLGFMLMFGVIFYVAGTIVAWTQRNSFKVIDFAALEQEELKNSKCPTLNEPQPREFALTKKLQEKFIHM